MMAEADKIPAMMAYMQSTALGSGAAWFGPLAPLAPAAPREVAGRRFDFPSGYNLRNIPRGDEPTSFPMLRALADNYDLMRLVIETRKDQVNKLKWTITVKEGVEGKAAEARVQEVSDFLLYPDREHDWDAWLRMLIEDMLVIDGATIYPRRTRGGGVYALEIVDGATIKPVLDDHGRRPLPPGPAYQQVLKGLPAVDYTADELIYAVRNPRSAKVYGYSPVEQVVMTVNIALRRQLHQLQYYTEGSVPEALIGVPETWNPDQIADFQAYWDALLSGDTAQRRHAKFVPATISKSYVATKDAALKDEYDEWLARIVCYAFSVSPQWAVKEMNRATAETSTEQAFQEGLAPIQEWIKGVMDRIIAFVFGYRDIEFVWKEEEEQAPKEQAEVNILYLDAGVLNRNEVRETIGRGPIDAGDVYTVKTATGIQRLQDVVAAPPPPPQIGHNGGPPIEEETRNGMGADGASKDAAEDARGGDQAEADPLEKAAKRPKAVAKPRTVDRERDAVIAAEARLTKIWEALFAAERARLAQATLGKAAGDDRLDAEAWSTASDATAKILRELALDGVAEGVASLGIVDQGVTDLANDRAVAWAQRHAAELIKDLETTTRDRLQALTAEAETEGWSVDRLSAAIAEDPTFDAERAQLIAHHETRTADNQANLESWRAAKDRGVKVGKQWVTRGANICQECEENAAAGAIDVDDAFPSGDMTSPAHPRCECDVEPVILDD